jgi:hypothetical protein
MIHNNLKANAKLILKHYSNDMDIDTINFYNDLSNNSYLTTEKIQRYNFCEFRYSAKNSGLI